MELCERVSSPKFTHPSNIAIYGNTGTGKTHFLYSLLSNANLYFSTRDGENIKKIVHCYGSVWQPVCLIEWWKKESFYTKVYQITLNSYLKKKKDQV